MKLALVTGVSRGLGQATAKLLLEKGIHVLGISRSGQDLRAQAENKGVSYEHLSKDLSDLEQVKQVNERLRALIREKEVKQLYLVNNAAMLGPIDQGMNYDPEELAKHVQINTVAPMVLMNHHLKISEEKAIPFTGVTITSGAAERPIYGWSGYCSTKASINMYTETIALEQRVTGTSNKVFAFSPGVMDTDMQAEIRSSTEKEFKDVESFKQYKEMKALREPSKVAQVLVKLLLDEETESGKVYYVRDYE